MSPTPTFQPPEPQRSGMLTALVAGALITLLAANIYLYVQIDHLRHVHLSPLPLTLRCQAVEAVENRAAVRRIEDIVHAAPPCG